MKNNRTLLIIVGIILICCCILGVGAVIAGPAVSNYFNSLKSGFQLNPASTSAPATSGPSTSAPSTSSPSTSAPSGGPASGGLGDDLLKTDVWNAIVNYEGGQSCNDVKSTTIDVNNGPDSKGVWTENWTVQACGQAIVFKVKFTPDSKGGTSFSVSH